MKYLCRNLPVKMVSIILSLWIAGCIDLPTDFKVPQWDVDLNVPIINRSYTLNDIIKKQNYISVQGTSSADSIFVLQSDTYSQSTDISKFIQVTTQTASRGNIIPVSNLGSVTIYLPIPEGAELDDAVFTSGLLSFHVVNPNLEDVNINVTFPGILKNGAELNIPLTVRALQQDSIQSSLAGCIYKIPANQLTQNRSSIQMIVSASSASLPVVSVVTMDFYSSDFYFSSVTGYLPSKSVGTKSQSFSLNLGSAEDYRDKASLKEGKLELNVNYYSPSSDPFAIQVKNLNIIGMREDGTQMALTDYTTNSSDITFNIEKGSTHLVYTEANSNINSFISFLPSKILLNAEYIMNPTNGTGSATDQDSIVFSTGFSTKSVMSLQKSLITDTTSLNISDQDGPKIKDAKSAYINVNVQNGIPLDTWLTITFADNQYSPLFTLTNSSNSDSIYIGAANINSDGEVSGAVTTNNLIQLDSVQTLKLSKARYAIYVVAVQTNGASGSSAPKVAVRPNDLIKINVYGGVKYHVNTDDLK